MTFSFPAWGTLSGSAVLLLLPLLGPNLELLLFAVGLALIYLELNRPGLVLPGATGLLAVLLAVANALRWGITPLGAACVLTAFALLVVELRRALPLAATLAAAALLAVGLLRLHPTAACSTRASGVSSPLAVALGLLLAGGTSLLTRLARRARANKAVN